jgi:hypothetical protein
MFLVQNDETGTVQRREKRATWSDDDVRVPAVDPFPFIELLSSGEAAVQERHAPWKARDEPLHRLSGKGNLRHKTYRLAPRGECMTGGAQIDLGLAAAGNTEDEMLRECTAIERRNDRLKRRGLSRGEHRHRGRIRGAS